jgi:hypothetical protein
MSRQRQSKSVSTKRVHYEITFKGDLTLPDATDSAKAGRQLAVTFLNALNDFLSKHNQPLVAETDLSYIACDDEHDGINQV